MSQSTPGPSLRLQLTAVMVGTFLLVFEWVVDAGSNSKENSRE